MVQDQLVVIQTIKEQPIINWVMVYQVLETSDDKPSNENMNGDNQRIRSGET